MNEEKDVVTVSFRLPELLLKKLDKYCKDNDLTRSQVMRRILREEYQKEKTS